MRNERTKPYKALLLDLDGTLLDLDIKTFVPAYIEALSGKFTGFISKDNFVKCLFEATNKMVQNVDPFKNNETVFYEEFYRLLDQPFEQIKHIEKDFLPQ